MKPHKHRRKEQDTVAKSSKSKGGGRSWTKGLDKQKNDGFGLDLVCERNGQRHRIEARSVELLEPLPVGHLFLAAYLAWKRFV